MATIIKCPGCGAEIDTERNIAEFRSDPPEISPPADDTPAGESHPAPATRPRGNAFFKPRKKE